MTTTDSLLLSESRFEPVQEPHVVREQEVDELQQHERSGFAVQGPGSSVLPSEVDDARVCVLRGSECELV